jgi:hypothetical protein
MLDLCAREWEGKPLKVLAAPRLDAGLLIRGDDEIYFSIVQRKVLSPNDFPSLDALAERLLDFQYYWESAAQPFEWKFNRQDWRSSSQNSEIKPPNSIRRIRDRTSETVY